MTEATNSSPDDSDGIDSSEFHARIEDFQDDGEGGMTLERFEEIAEAEDRGIDFELSAEERVEYEAAKVKMAETMALLRASVSKPFQDLNKRVNGLIREAIRMPKLQSPVKIDGPGSSTTPTQVVPPPTGNDLARQHYSAPIPGEDVIAKVRSAAKQRQAREEESAQAAVETALTLKKMLLAMDESSKTENRHFWLAATLAFLAAIGGIIAAVPVVVAFGQQAGWW
ncbi:hypothetical protein [Arthrobacter sp. D2-10]